jgi:hypothetical protein
MVVTSSEKVNQRSTEFRLKYPTLIWLRGCYVCALWRYHFEWLNTLLEPLWTSSRSYQAFKKLGVSTFEVRSSRCLRVTRVDRKLRHLPIQVLEVHFWGLSTIERCHNMRRRTNT